MKPTQEELVTKYINLIYYFAKRWIYRKEDIDDLVQETYFKAFKNYDTFVYTSENQLKSWLLTICRNSVISTAKEKKKLIQVHNVEDFLQEDENNIEKWLDEEIKKEDLRILDEHFDNLRDEDKDILKLRFYEDMSFKQVSEILSISEPATKMRCYRALKKLKEKMI